LERAVRHYKISVQSIIQTAQVPRSSFAYVAFNLLTGHALDLAIQIPPEPGQVLPPYASIMALVDSLAYGSEMSKLARLEKLESFGFYEAARKAYLAQLTNPNVIPTIPDIAYILQLYRQEAAQLDEKDTTDLVRCRNLLKAVEFKPLVMLVRRVTDTQGKTQDVTNPEHLYTALICHNDIFQQLVKEKLISEGIYRHPNPSPHLLPNPTPYPSPQPNSHFSPALSPSPIAQHHIFNCRSAAQLFAAEKRCFHPPKKH
jgi:hypothetical protein